MVGHCRWNGKSWKTFPTPAKISEFGLYTGVVTPPGGGVWVTGDVSAVNNSVSGGAMHWDGHSWTVYNLNPEASVWAAALDGHGGLWAVTEDGFSVAPKDAEHAGWSAAELAYQYATQATDPDYSQYDIYFQWNCRSCHGLVCGDGQYGSPAASQRGHANDCSRFAKAQADWDAGWEDIQLDAQPNQLRRIDRPTNRRCPAGGVSQPGISTGPRLGSGQGSAHPRQRPDPGARPGWQ